MRKLFYLLGLVIALVSCNGKNDVAGEVEVIDIQEGVENRGHVMLSKYASEIKYTPLETSIDCMMWGDEYVSQHRPTTTT